MKVSTASQLTYIKHNTIMQNPILFKKLFAAQVSSSFCESKRKKEFDENYNVIDVEFDC